LTLVVGLIVPTFLKELICKGLGLLDMRLSRVLLRSPRDDQSFTIKGDVNDFLVIDNSSMSATLDNVPGQMTHLVAILTLDSARSCVMQGEFLTQGKASSIPTVFSWGDNISPDVLGTVATEKYRFSSFKPADEANSAFRTFEIERLATHKLFVATFSCYRSFTLSGVPIGIVSICHRSSLYFQSCGNIINN
ncbi:hypothetical protein Tco_1432426, partial [Tanacetum coccineum]